MKKLIILLSVLMISAPVWAATGTSSATVKMFKAWLSLNGDCSSPVAFINEPSGKSFDFASNPTLGTGSIAAGTYKCFIIKISDNVSFTPSANEGTACVAGTSYTMDVCRDYGNGQVPQVTNPDDGSKTTCTSGEDTIYVYISRFSTAAAGSQDNNAFAPPTQDGDSTNGFKLANDIVVSADLTGTFTFGTDNKVGEQQTGSQGATQCGMEPPDFGFAAQ
ncbi:MAG: hypothetical protein HYS22_05825 [Deltaproteobacteria bacterium]|nr:hypothetical protein [Deltaproteobacteria bacterium]